jgi:hypothetical protein
MTDEEEDEMEGMSASEIEALGLSLERLKAAYAGGEL